MNAIDTASALSKMNDTWDENQGREKTYGLRFLKSGGVGEIYNARKGVKFPQQQAKKSNRSRAHTNLKMSGLVQVYDNDLKQFRDIFFDCIFAFRDHNTTQWIQTKLT